jgi:hypothetical protein
MATRLNALVKRPINLIHMPVPRDRSDDAYFAPLKTLKLRPETTFALGLVHHTDGLDGTARRMGPRENMRRTSPSARNAVSAGASRRPFPNCCVSMRRPRSSINAHKRAKGGR